MDGAIELTGRQRLDRVAAGKQPTPRQQQAAPPPLPPPGAQPLEQLRRQHCMAVPRFREGRLLRPLPRSTLRGLRGLSRLQGWVNNTPPEDPRRITWLLSNNDALRFWDIGHGFLACPERSRDCWLGRRRCRLSSLLACWTYCYLYCS